MNSYRTSIWQDVKLFRIILQSAKNNVLIVNRVKVIDTNI